MQPSNLTPAAAAAMAAGDITNFIAASTPGGIERQEAQGQVDFCASQSLPKAIRGATRAQLEAIGFVFGKDIDDLFVECKLPAGWEIKPTDHSMHNDLLDDKGRKRAGIFYKAAFYDRNAHMNMRARYDYVNDYEKPESMISVLDRATGATIKTFGPFKWDNWDVYDEMERQARSWLDENYPEHHNPLAYWAD